MTLLPLHVAGGVIGILSGLIALYVFKGGTLHRKSGMVFVYAMLVMSLSGAVVAVGRPGALMNVPAGLVTAYLVITSLLTVRSSSARTRQVERGAMVAAFALGASSIVAAIVSGAKGNVGFVYPLVMFAALAVSAGLGDRRMIRAGGLRGRERIRRHLWRMCTALFIAAASFFLGPVRRIPEPLRTPALRLIPFVVLATMAYWLWRYRRKRIAHAAIHATVPEAM
jgi:succinate-acetate transporter protein